MFDALPNVSEISPAPPQAARLAKSATALTVLKIFNDMPFLIQAEHLEFNLSIKDFGSIGKDGRTSLLGRD